MLSNDQSLSEYMNQVYGEQNQKSAIQSQPQQTQNPFTSLPPEYQAIFQHLLGPNWAEGLQPPPKDQANNDQSQIQPLVGTVKQGGGIGGQVLGNQLGSIIFA